MNLDDKSLFFALAREGERWHSPGDGNPWCLNCPPKGIFIASEHINPNFSSPSWPEFGFLMERGPEKEWWPIFRYWIATDKVYSLARIKAMKITDYKMAMCKEIPEIYINPPRIFEALREFLEERK